MVLKIYKIYMAQITKFAKYVVSHVKAHDTASMTGM